jgi:hypothetical protein
MGQRASAIIPRYVKDFNIENRVSKQMDRMEQNVALKISPRHPSTAERFKQIEGFCFKHKLKLKDLEKKKLISN